MSAMKYDRETELARWQALADERDCTVAALVEFWCRLACWELDSDADETLH
jgi:hypothetical protein